MAQYDLATNRNATQPNHTAKLGESTAVVEPALELVVAAAEADGGLELVAEAVPVVWEGVSSRVPEAVDPSVCVACIVVAIAVPVRVVIAALERFDPGGSTPYVLPAGVELAAETSSVLRRGLSVDVAAIASSLLVTWTLKTLQISAMAANVAAAISVSC